MEYESILRMIVSMIVNRDKWILRLSSSPLPQDFSLSFAAALSERCHAPAGSRCRHPDPPGTAGPLRCLDHDEVHPRGEELQSCRRAKSARWRRSRSLPPFAWRRKNGGLIRFKRGRSRKGIPGIEAFRCRPITISPEIYSSLAMRVSRRWARHGTSCNLVRRSRLVPGPLRAHRVFHGRAERAGRDHEPSGKPSGSRGARPWICRRRSTSARSIAAATTTRSCG